MFLLFALVLSIATGLAFAVSGAGLTRALLMGFLALVALQVLYVLFVLLKTLMLKRDRKD